MRATVHHTDPASVRMTHLQRSVTALVAAMLATIAGQPVRAQTAPPTHSGATQSAAATPSTSAAPTEDSETDTVEPVLPPGISDFDIEVYTTLAYTWKDPTGTDVIECLGSFSGRMGQHRISSSDAVIWFTRKAWNDKPYYDLEVFLWRDAEVRQPGGTIETGPALIITLRSFGRLLLNADSHSSTPDAGSDLMAEASRARRLLDVVPAEKAETASRPVVVSPTIEQLRMARPRPLKIVEFSVGPNGMLTHEQHGEESVFVAIGDVLVSQGSPSISGEYLELRADAAVLFLNKEQVGEGVSGLFEDGKPKKPDRTTQPADVPPEREAPLSGKKAPREAMKQWVSAAYLEGDVVLTRGQRMIRAEKLFYDFQNDRALILDVVARALEPSQKLPIYVRAARVRQLSASEYTAINAQITSSEFHTPHVAIGAREVYLKDNTPRNEAGDIVGVEAGTYVAKDTTLNVDGVPILYWPVSRGDFSRDRQAFRSAKFGYQSDFGASMETKWYLFNVLGLEQPPGYDATLKLDYYTKRGPGAGVDADYQRENYYGLVRSYYIHDHGEDDLGGNRGGDPDHEDRGRFLLRHRQFLPQDWELTLETSYISDDNYLESFERNEFENGKDQETLAYLLKRRDNWQFSSLVNYRINEFQTQTEHLPDTRFSLIGEPLSDYATFYHDSRAGTVRYRGDERRFFNGHYRLDNTGSTGSVLRADSREEMEFPLPDGLLGPLKLVPFLLARGTAWDDSTDIGDPGSNHYGRGGLQRGFGGYGVKGSATAAKADDRVESDLLDLHRLRHVVKGDFELWNAHANEPSKNITPFDSGVENVDDFGGGTLGLRQRFQTKRGGPGRWRSVDWITVDLEAGFFNNKRPGDRTHGDFIFARPEDSISSNFIAGNVQYRISDSTVVVYDGVYDSNRGNMGTSNVSLAVERDPRLAYFVGWRYIHDTNNNLVGFGTNYRLTEKHAIAVREYYDIEQARNLSTEVSYVRKWPRWYTAISFDVDRTLDDVGVNFSIWPEGAPNLGLGSKRYTGLADAVGLRP